MSWPLTLIKILITINRRNETKVSRRTFSTTITPVTPMIGNVDILTWIILFIAYIIFDALYGWYIIAVQNLKITLATFLSLMIGTISYGGVIKIVDNPYCGVPIILGGGLGTFLILWWQKKKMRKEKEISK